MKVSSKDFYRELRLVLGPTMKTEGFSLLKGGRAAWTRQTLNGHLSVWFQCDKWGWDDAWGSKFTVEFQIANQRSDAMSMAGTFDRIGYLLEGFPELDELRLRSNSVIERLPGTRKGLIVESKLPDGTDFVAIGEKADPLPAIYGRDIWLVYYSIDDAREWARYFEGNLLRFVSMFENEAKSEQRRARERQDAMITRVQESGDIREKAKILQEFARTEPDAHFAAGALALLNDIPEKYRS